MVKPVWNLRIDWDNAGDYSHAEADVTNEINDSMTAYRGRDFAGYVAALPSPGRLTARLKNTSGDYSFFNTSGPIHGDLLPGCLVQLRATYSGTTYSRWTGYLDSMRAIAPLTEVPSMELEAAGALAYINQQSISLPAQVKQLSSAIQNAILDAAGWPATARAIDTGQTELGYYFGGAQRQRPRRRATDLLREMEVTEGGQSYEGRGGEFVSHDRHFRPLNRTSMRTFSDRAGPNVIGVSHVEHQDPLDTLFTDFAADIEDFQPDSVDTAAHARIWTLGAIIPIAPGDPIPTIIQAKFQGDREYVGVSSWDEPVITANSRAEGGGRDLLSDLTVTVTPYVIGADISIANGNPDETAYITAMTIDGVRLRAVSEATVSKTSPTITPNAPPRAFPNKPKFNDPQEAERWSRWQRALYDAPQPVLRITYPAFHSDAALTAALQLDIANRITVDLQGATQIAVNRDFFIERITDFIDLDGNLTVTYDLISATPHDQWWTLGQQTLGEEPLIPW